MISLVGNSDLASTVVDGPEKNINMNGLACSSRNRNVVDVLNVRPVFPGGF